MLAVREFLALPEAPALAAANKRVGNILKKSDVADRRASTRRCSSEPAEQRARRRARPTSARAPTRPIARGEYARSLACSPACKPSVDAFFDSVMVNAESPALRANRLALLAALRTTMNRVADLSRLAV